MVHVQIYSMLTIKMHNVQALLRISDPWSDSWVPCSANWPHPCSDAWKTGWAREWSPVFSTSASQTTSRVRTVLNIIDQQICVELELNAARWSNQAVLYVSNHIHCILLDWEYSQISSQHLVYQTWVCAILLRLYTSTERLKSLYTQAQGHFWKGIF